MYSQHPKIAARWEKETPKKKLPDKKELEEMPKMGSVFEGKKKKKDKKDIKPIEVGCVPESFWSPLGEGFDMTLDEDLDIKKLHSTEDFVNELQQFSSQMHAEVKALQTFIDSKKSDKKIHQGMRSKLVKIAQIIRGIDAEAEDLNSEVDQLASYMMSIGDVETQVSAPEPVSSGPQPSVEKLFRK
jgi:myosin heavy subunit